MKKTLLFATLAFSFSASAQSFTQANEAPIASTQTMFLCDSFVDKQIGVTGSGVTWDFTGMFGYAGETRDLTIGSSAASPSATDFPTSIKTLELAAIETFYNSSATERMSQGFVYTEPGSGGVYKAVFDTDEAKLMEYPFSNGSSLTDAYSGTFYYDIIGPDSSPLTGEINVAIDGEGTLNLPNGVSYTNVLRLVSSDSSASNVTTPFGASDVVIKRTQYEYYDLANSSLPVLVIATIGIESALLNDEQTVVLSLDDPGNYANVTENTFEFSISPNPSSNNITIKGEIEDDSKASILNQNGQVVLTTTVSNNTSIDISSLDNGVYFLSVISNGVSTTKTIVKK